MSFIWPPAPRPDKRAILEALKRGEEVPGVRIAQGERVETGQEKTPHLGGGAGLN
ncbi:MAG: siphovirus Gp157 family protein [Pseudomonas sp.]|uniref:siphovirus Gp157 family protein n=1 Tax=Pseudomonas sp. TaxID=306 RepID=UPI00391A4304